MEWTNEMIMSFLDYYADEPVIWNAWHPSNRKREDVVEAWKRIEEKMGGEFSVEQLKKKKDSLMASYRVVTRRTKSILDSGEGDGYKPTWFAYEKMASFLSGKHGRRSAFKAQASRIGNAARKISDDCIEVPVPEERTIIIPVDVPSPHKQEEDLQSTPEDTGRLSLKKRRISTANEEIIAEPVIDSYSILQNTKEREERDYCDKYGIIVASRLRQLDEWHRDSAINKIDNILYEEKRKYLGRLGNHTPNHSRE